MDGVDCPSCGSDDVRGDVEEYGVQDWVYDDPAAAKDDPEAPGHSRGGRTFRCRRCHNTWGQAR
jgi:hypothetical protein